MWSSFIVLLIIIIMIIIALIISRGFSARDSIIGRAQSREVEARFLNVDVDDIRARIRSRAMRGKLVFDTTLMTRAVYSLPDGYARVRTEPHKTGQRVVLTSKTGYSKQHSDSHSAVAVAPVETEIMLAQNVTYDEVRQFMQSIGMRQKAEHEQLREEWRVLKPAQGIIEIDWMPGLLPSIEIEAASDEDIRAIARALNLDYDSAVFGHYGMAYARAYIMSEDVTNNQISELKFASIERIMGPFIRGNHEDFARANLINLSAINQLHSSTKDDK